MTDIRFNLLFKSLFVQSSVSSERGGYHIFPLWILIDELNSFSHALDLPLLTLIISIKMAYNFAYDIFKCIYFQRGGQKGRETKIDNNKRMVVPLTTIFLDEILNMIASSNGNIFRVTGHLCGELTGPRWIPHTKASDVELWCLLWSASE